MFRIKNFRRRSGFRSIREMPGPHCESVIAIFRAEVAQTVEKPEDVDEELRVSLRGSGGRLRSIERPRHFRFRADRAVSQPANSVDRHRASGVGFV